VYVPVCPPESASTSSNSSNLPVSTHPMHGIDSQGDSQASEGSHGPAEDVDDQLEDRKTRVLLSLDSTDSAGSVEWVSWTIVGDGQQCDYDTRHDMVSQAVDSTALHTGGTNTALLSHGNSDSICITALEESGAFETVKSR
jgi:hypothetical protein